jgi:hypothetical protein
MIGKADRLPVYDGASVNDTLTELEAKSGLTPQIAALNLIFNRALLASARLEGVRSDAGHGPVRA